LEADHHAGEPMTEGRAFAIAIALNLAFVLIEFFYGRIAHSLALVADAGHNLSDVLSLGLAWGAGLLSTRRPTRERTYGLRRSSILAALINAGILLIVLGAIAWESIQRFSEPDVVAGTTVMWVAGIGILINGGTALLFLSGRHGDLNIRGAFLHMAGDALVSIGVVITGALINLTGAHWIDPIVSLAISAFIFHATWGLLRASVNLALDAVPDGIEMTEVERYLGSLSNVVEVHDLHVWAMSTTETALTAHLVMAAPICDNAFLLQTEQELRHRFHIGHATLQLELDDPARSCACRLLHKH